MRRLRRNVREMILFYAWTDTQIITLVNIKLNTYSNEKADLLIYKLSRVSEELIIAVKKSNLFANIYELDRPVFCLERKRKGIRERMEAVFLGSKYRKYFDEQLKQLIGEKEYVVFFTSAFWSETLLVIQYIKKYSQTMAIWLYEEGLAAYNGPKNWLFQAVPDKSIKAGIRTVLYYGISSYTYRRYVKGIFLYKPQLTNLTYLDRKQIPPIDDRENPICYEISKAPYHKNNRIYEECEIIYISDAPNLKSKYPLESVYQVLDNIYLAAPDAKVILKLHPIMQSVGIVFNAEKYPTLSVDWQTERIESILLQLNIDHKIIITGNSTSALYLKWVYGKSPYLVLTDWCNCNQRITEYTKRYYDNDDTGKVYVSKNQEELKEILKEILVDR